MGKTFIDCNLNGLNLEDVYNKLFSKNWKIIEASEEKYFYRIPELKEVKEIEVGCDGTKETILRLNGGGFAVIGKTIKL